MSGRSFGIRTKKLLNSLMHSGFVGILGLSNDVVRINMLCHPPISAIFILKTLLWGKAVYPLTHREPKFRCPCDSSRITQCLSRSNALVTMPSFLLPAQGICASPVHCNCIRATWEGRQAKRPLSCNPSSNRTSVTLPVEIPSMDTDSLSASSY